MVDRRIGWIGWEEKGCEQSKDRTGTVGTGDGRGGGGEKASFPPPPPTRPAKLSVNYRIMVCFLISLSRV